MRCAYVCVHTYIYMVERLFTKTSSFTYREVDDAGVGRECEGGVGGAEDVVRRQDAAQAAERL